MVSCPAGRFGQTFRSAKHDVMGDCRKACAMVFDAIAKALASAGSIDPAEIDADFTMKMSSLEEASNIAMPLCRSTFIQVYVLESSRVCTCTHRSYGYS